MNSTALQERVGLLILKGINVDVPSTETDLFETGVLDSLAFVELLVRLEQEFGIRIALEELDVERFRSIARVAEFVAGRVSLIGNAPGAPMECPARSDVSR